MVLDHGRIIAMGAAPDILGNPSLLRAAGLV